MYDLNSVHFLDTQMLLNKVEKLNDEDVHLFGIQKDIYDELKNYSEYFLNKEEQDRAKKFRFRKHHDLYVIGRYLTKIMLAYYTDRNPESVKIIPDSNGKPICEMNLFFNISHSDDLLLLGFSKSKIGVDIEKINPTVDIENIGRNHFSNIELQKMMSCPEDERVEMFYKIWTKKESLIKGIGKGLSIPLKDFDVTGKNGKILWKKSPSGENYGNWNVQNIETNQGYTSAFATQIIKFKISYFTID